MDGTSLTGCERERERERDLFLFFLFLLGTCVRFGKKEWNPSERQSGAGGREEKQRPRLSRFLFARLGTRERERRESVRIKVVSGTGEMAPQTVVSDISYRRVRMCARGKDEREGSRRAIWVGRRDRKVSRVLFETFSPRSISKATSEGGMRLGGFGKVVVVASERAATVSNPRERERDSFQETPLSATELVTS